MGAEFLAQRPVDGDVASNDLEQLAGDVAEHLVAERLHRSGGVVVGAPRKQGSGGCWERHRIGICTLRGQTPRVPTLTRARKCLEIKGESLEPASGLEPLTC